MLESQFRKEFLERLKARLYPVQIDVISTKPHNRSIPDDFIIGPRFWAALEYKKSANAPHRPNQDYHIERLNEIGYAAFVYPENGEEIIDDLERLFK